MTIMKEIRGLFVKPTPLEVAASELDQAELALLEHLSAAEFSQAMVGYQENRIKRLRAYLKARATT